MPDIGTAYYQSGDSTLTSFAAYNEYYMTANSVHYARFFGNRILLDLAILINNFFPSADFRLHPLRISAAILTPLYFIIGAFPAIFISDKIYWQKFLTYYSLMFFSGLYVFYPCDAPSLALTSIGIYFFIENRVFQALFCMLLTGVFRESSFHFVIFSLIFSLTNVKASARFLLFPIFLISFLIEYKVIRYYFPGPISSIGLLPGFQDLFTGKGLISLTTIVTLSLALTFPAKFLLMRNTLEKDWIYDFLKINAYIFPIWILFYRLMSGNISEFRIMWPILIPCIYGIALKK
jgi:hypothetical protein